MTYPCEPHGANDADSVSQNAHDQPRGEAATNPQELPASAASPGSGTDHGNVVGFVRGVPLTCQPLFIALCSVSSVAFRRGKLRDPDDLNSYRWHVSLVCDGKPFEWEYNNRDVAMEDATVIASRIGESLRESVRVPRR